MTAGRLTRRALGAALVVHLALAFLVLRVAWGDPLHSLPGPALYGHLPNTDNVQLLWFVRWAPYAVQHLQDPLHTAYLNAPAGANGMWNPLMLIPALIVSPATLLGSPQLGLTLMGTLALTCSGLAATAAARRLVALAPVAVLAGALYEVSPFLLAHSQGHTQIVAGAALPPVTLLLLLDVLAQRRHTLAAGALLGLAAAATYYTWTESLLVPVFAGAIGVVVAALMSPGAVRDAAPRLAACLGVAFLVAAVLMVPGAVMQFAGPQHLYGAVRDPNIVVTDLQNLVVPTQLEAVAPGAAVPASGAWTGNVLEWGGYVGVPLLVVIAATAALAWRRPAVRWLTAMFVLLAALALGPTLHVGGTSTGIPLPWRIADHVPLLQDMLAGRLEGVAFLAAVLLLAIAVDELVRRRRRLLAAAAVLPVAVSLAPAPLAAVTPPVPAYFTSSGAQQVPDGSVALVAPYASPYSANAMLWQAASGLRFRMPEGYVLLPTPAGPKLAEYPAPTATSAAMMAVEAGGTVPQDGSQRAAMLADLRRWNVGTVIVGPMAHEDAMVATFSWLLGRAPTETQGVFVWSGVQA